MSKLSFHVLAVMLWSMVMVGCMGTPRITDPIRTAVEQLLLSTAVDKAFKDIDLTRLAGVRVFLDAHGFEATDKAYAITLTSMVLGKYGALIAEDMSEAEAVAAITSGALSIDRSDSLLGIPSLAIPIPLSGYLRTPEIAFYKVIKQTGIAKLAINVYEKPTGRQIFAIGPVSGTSYYNYHKVFFAFSYRTTDIQEKKKGWWSKP